MALTSIGFQKTPARPVQITFAANTNLPNPNQTLGLIGHMGPTSGAPVSGVASGSSVPYSVVPMANVADPVAGATEANAKFGAGSELAKMVIAAINANFDEGNANFPMITCVPLAQTDVGFGAANVAGTPAALAACDKFECEFLVSPYDGAVDPQPVNNPLTKLLITQATAMSGPSRVQNNQFGTFAVTLNRSVTSPANLPKYDTQYITTAWLRDTNTRVYSIGEDAAAYAALVAGGVVPFNSVDDTIIGGVAAPSSMNDWITVGAGLESEAALNQGWTPLRVLPTGDVAIVRSVTARLTSDGTTPVLSYYDVQDFQVLYFLRKAIKQRYSQPDFTNVKLSEQKLKDGKAAVVALLSSFEDQGMVQAVAQLAPLVQVQGNATDRSRMDVFVPTNVVPNLHVIATNLQATTEFDVVSA